MKSLMNYGNPLYGRFDLKLELKPLNYYESQLFYNDYSNEDKVKIYSVFGGIPYYNKFIDVKKSVKENIINLIAREGSILENEIPIYLLGQLSKINNANIVFEVLAKNYTKYKDILISSGQNEFVTTLAFNVGENGIFKDENFNGNAKVIR